MEKEDRRIKKFSSRDYGLKTKKSSLHERNGETLSVSYDSCLILETYKT